MIRRRLSAALGVGALTLVGVSVPALASPGQSATDLDNLPGADQPTRITQLVQQLMGDSTTVSNVRFLGSKNSAGTFAGFDSLGLDKGIVLSTGCVAVFDVCRSTILGPNQDSFLSADMSAPGDSDLSALIGGTKTKDATVLEFDFVPSGDTISFSYIFGSDEYPQYVGAIDDVFGFFVNGTNQAKLPNGEAISIANVNAAKNADSFRANDAATATYDTQMNGLTTVLTFTASVNKGVTNHIKLAIADAVDAGGDSSVLVKAGSFTSTAPPAAPTRQSVTVPVPQAS